MEILIKNRKMDANELRVGNYVVYIKDGQIYEADFITINLSNNYTGIKLTEEWLLKFGFEIGNNSYECGEYYLISDFGEFYLRKSYRGGFYWGFDNDNEINNQNNIEYINQLQNLYFALTGKELTITP